MKYYDKELYRKEKAIEATLIIFITFFIGFCFGCCIQEQADKTINSNLEREVINHAYNEPR